MRRCFMLVGPTIDVGAALTTVGVLGVEGPDEQGRWSTHVSWIPFLEETAEGWRTVVAEAIEDGGITGPLVDQWVVTANGITRDITEVETPAAAPTLALAVEHIVEVVIMAAHPRSSRVR